jgi:hypothetical protein
MNTLKSLSVGQLKQALAVRVQIESLKQQLSQILGGEIIVLPAANKKRKMSPAARAKIGAAQRARWAKVHGNTVEKTSKRKRKMSAAGRAAISAAATARWKKAKAAGKSKL